MVWQDEIKVHKGCIPERTLNMIEKSLWKRKEAANCSVY
jgi:hypothetical protein